MGNLFKMKKLIVGLSFLSAFFILSPSSVFAATLNMSADTGGAVNVNGTQGGVVIYSVASGTRAFIQAIPDSGKTFSGWEDGYTTYSSTLNPIVTTSVTANALFSNAPSAIMSINNQCVERVITFTNTTARAEGQSQISGLAKTQIYILEGSNEGISPQDSTGYLFSSPNQSFYYAFNASTVGSGVYLGSNAAFRGRTSYLSLGSANVTSDVRYNCAGASVTRHDVTLSTNLPANVTPPTLVGAGTYNNNSIVTISTTNVPNYTFVGWSGTCGNTAFLFPNNTVKVTYTHTITNLNSSCDFQAQYSYVPLTSTGLLTVTVSADPNGTVTLNGLTGGTVTANVPYGSTITVSANPSSGYEHAAWTNAFYGLGSSFSYQVTSNINALASFSALSVAPGTGSCGSFAPDLKIYSNVDGGGSMLVGLGNSALLTSTTSPSGISYFTVSGNGYTYNCTEWLVPVPTPNYGYSFIGWVGNLATSTMLRLKQSGYIQTSDLNGISNPQITAIFDLNGNPSGSVVGNELVRPISQSPTAVFNSELVDYSTRFSNESGVFPYTPYFIDGRCVVKVAKFKAREVGFFSSIFQSFAGSEHTYTIYGLEGSDFSHTQQSGGIYSGVYTFKSDPSELYLSIDGGTLPPGSYNGTDPFFSARQQSFDFVNVVPLENPKDYSCDDSNLNSVSSLQNVSIFAFDNPVSGYAYHTLTGDNMVTVYGTGTTFFPSNFSSSSPFYSYDGILADDLYQRVFCNAGNSGVKMGVYCAMPVATSSYSIDTGQTASYFDYKYIWVLTSHPMKGFYHQEVSNWEDVLADGRIEESEKIYGIQFFPPDKSITLRNGSSTLDYGLISDEYLSNTSHEECSSGDSSCIGEDDLNLYATRIDLSKCYFYETVLAFKESGESTSCALSLLDNGSVQVLSSLLGSRFTQATLNNRTNPLQLNGFFVDEVDDFDKDVLFYRMLLTSNAAINFSSAESIAQIQKKFSSSRSKDVVRYAGVKSKMYATVSTSTIFVATSTVDGYWVTVPGYSTSTTSTSTVYSTTTNWSSGYTTYSTTDKQGYTVVPNFDTHIGGVVKASYITATEASLYLKSSNALIDTATFSGDVATFSSAIGLTSGVAYDIVLHKGGSSFTSAYNSAVTFPIVNTQANFTHNAYNNGTWNYNTNGNPVGGLVSIFTYVSTTTDSYVATSSYYVATSTTPSYTYTSTSTAWAIGEVPVSTSSESGLFYFTSGSYNASVGLEGFSSLSSYSASLFAQYDVNDPIYGCYKDEYSVAQSIGCALRSVIGSLFLTIFLPDEKQLKVMNDGLNNMVVSGGIISTILSTPLRSVGYSNLSWRPSTTTPLTIGFSSTSKATIDLGSAPSTPLAKSDKLISDFIYPFLLVGLLLLTGMSAIKIFL